MFAPFTTKALELRGSKALFTSADFPGSIPDHLVFDKAFVNDHPERVQELVGAWFDTVDYIEQNKDEAVAIMARRAGVSPEEYADYDKGTRIFTKADNQAAFEPGDDMSHLDFAAKSIAGFLVNAGLVEREPDLAGLLEPKFIGAAGAP